MAASPVTVFERSERAAETVKAPLEIEETDEGTKQGIAYARTTVQAREETQSDVAPSSIHEMLWALSLLWRGTTGGRHATEVRGNMSWLDRISSSLAFDALSGVGIEACRLVRRGRIVRICSKSGSQAVIRIRPKACSVGCICSGAAGSRQVDQCGGVRRISVQGERTRTSFAG